MPSSLLSTSSCSSSSTRYVIVAATLGSADMERVKLKATTDMPEWRATHDQGFMELPLAIQLEKFTIDEYPPQAPPHQ